MLFTSHRQLRDVHAALKHRVDLDEVLILGQGIDGQRRQVLKSFEEAERPLLLGTASFWEGIDVPGERLSCVIMVRLPFPVPSEPVYAARAEQVRDGFAQLALPQAALRLKQGFGRLIRRSTDRGAVVILDNRILGRDYGKAFLDVLPPASRFVGPAAEIAGPGSGSGCDRSLSRLFVSRLRSATSRMSARGPFESSVRSVRSPRRTPASPHGCSRATASASRSSAIAPRWSGADFRASWRSSTSTTSRS